MHAHRYRTFARHDLENACVNAVFLEGLRTHEVVDNEGKRPDSATRPHEVAFHRPGFRDQLLGHGIDKARMQAEPGDQAPQRRRTIVAGERYSRSGGLKLGNEACIGERVIERAVCLQTECVAVAPGVTDARRLEI